MFLPDSKTDGLYINLPLKLNTAFLNNSLAAIGTNVIDPVAEGGILADYVVTAAYDASAVAQEARCLPITDDMRFVADCDADTNVNQILKLCKIGAGNTLDNDGAASTTTGFLIEKILGTRKVAGRFVRKINVEVN